MTPAFTLTNESITVVHDGKPHTIQKGMAQFHVLRQNILDAIQTDSWEPVIASLSAMGGLQQFLSSASDRWSLDSAQGIRLDGTPVPQSIAERIKRMCRGGESIQPILRFYERLANNPSHRSVNQLFDFLQHMGIPLEEDGRFLAYKAVTDDLKDVHTRQIDNSPGVVNKMDRNLVSDDPDQGCHYGYHVGALSYASTFHTGGEMIICRVDPEHVVCVPRDSSYQKMRVCEYEVVGLYSGVPMADDVHREEIVDDEDGEWNDEDDDEEFGDDSSIAAAERELDGSDEPVHEEISARPAKKPTKPKNKAGQFGRMDAKKLLNESIGDLRAYAAHTLKIVGASKIPGGKSALVSKILKVRRKK